MDIHQVRTEAMQEKRGTNLGEMRAGQEHLKEIMANRIFLITT
jgi:hypothetical protein